MDDKDSRHRRGLIIALIVLGVFIVGLVIGIIIVGVKPAEAPGAESNNELNSYLEKIENEDPYISQHDLQTIIDLYQSQIDNAKSVDTKIELMKARLEFLITYDKRNTFKEIAISDAEFIDDNLSTIDSSVQVINTAVKYDDQAVVEEYQQIFEKRQLDNGLTPTDKGRG